MQLFGHVPDLRSCTSGMEKLLRPLSCLHKQRLAFLKFMLRETDYWTLLPFYTLVYAKYITTNSSNKVCIAIIRLYVILSITSTFYKVKHFSSASSIVERCFKFIFEKVICHRLEVVKTKGLNWKKWDYRTLFACKSWSYKYVECQLAMDRYEILEVY